MPFYLHIKYIHAFTAAVVFSCYAAHSFRLVCFCARFCTNGKFDKQTTAKTKQQQQPQNENFIFGITRQCRECVCSYMLTLLLNEVREERDIYAVQIDRRTNERTESAANNETEWLEREKIINEVTNGETKWSGNALCNRKIICRYLSLRDCSVLWHNGSNDGHNHSAATIWGNGYERWLGQHDKSTLLVSLFAQTDTRYRLLQFGVIGD